MEIGNLENIEYLDIFENMLFGKIPTSLVSFIRLEFWSMGRNFFKGAIPSCFKLIRGLDYLDLSNNNLSGTIPKFLESFC